MNLTRPANGINRPSLPVKELPAYSRRDLSSFVTEGTLQLFQCFKVDTGFFELDPSAWPASTSYQDARKVFKNLIVVNDPAERGVALAKRINNVLTTKEDRKQCIAKVIQSHIRKYPKRK